MAYDADGGWRGDRIGTRRPSVTEWEDPAAAGAFEILDPSVQGERDVRTLRHIQTKEQTMTKHIGANPGAQTSPDLSLDDFSIADLVGDLVAIEDERLAEALAFSPVVNNTRQVQTPDSDFYRLVEMPDELADPADLVLALSTDWRIPTSAHVDHIDAELSDRSNVIGTAYYTDTGEGHAVKVGRVMAASGEEKAIAAVYRTGKRWTLIHWGYTAHAAPSVLLDAIAAIRVADRSQVVEPFGLIGERVLVQLTDTGETNARGFQVTEAESYRTVNLNEDAVGMMRKLHRLARTAKARTSGLDVEDAGDEQAPAKGSTTPLPA